VDPPTLPLGPSGLPDPGTAAVVDFPLRGEWCALHTPAERIPSHGTDYFGQRFAFDFVRMNSEGNRFYPNSLLTHFFAVVPATAFFCWDQPVHSAFSGRVVSVGEDWPDRRWVNALWQLARATLFSRGPRGTDYRPLAGNFVLVEGDAGVALYAHLRRGSIRVRSGQAVAVGTELGSVGNSGNSTMPHLHFHLMGGRDPLTAEGRLCAFRSYERYDSGAWVAVAGGVPGLLERMRSA
jgi:hypothetical protein